MSTRTATFPATGRTRGRWIGPAAFVIATLFVIVLASMVGGASVPPPTSVHSGLSAGDVGRVFGFPAGDRSFVRQPGGMLLSGASCTRCAP